MCARYIRNWPPLLNITILYLSVRPNSTAYPEAEGTHIRDVDEHQGYRQSQQVVTAHIDDGYVKLFPTTTQYATKQSLCNKYTNRNQIDNYTYVI